MTSKSTALETRPPEAARPIAPTTAEIDLVKETIAPDASPAELRLFLFDCARLGVHPLDKLLYFSKIQGKYRPITSIDFLRSRAAASGEMAGSDDAAYLEAGDRLISASVTVYRLTQGQRFPYTATARLSEYAVETKPTWRQMPRVMLAKCAEAAALRKAFPVQLSGLYVTEEMDQGARELPTLEARAEAEPTIADVARTLGAIDPATGEERPRPKAPAGYYFGANYQLRGGFHEFDLLGYDEKGGALRVSTRNKIGAQAQAAIEYGLPMAVKVKDKQPHKVGEAYLEDLRVLDDGRDPF